MVFDQYPKIRKPLPPQYQEIYQHHFSQNRRGSTRASSITSKMESWMHRQVANDVNSATHLRTLELGAGSLNHLPYEPTIIHYDVVEPYQQILMENSPYKSRIARIYNDIFEITDNISYDRIISIAVLEHLEELPRVIAKSALLLNPSGSFRAGIPNEGTLLWKLGYSLTTGVEFRLRYGLDYNVLMRHEHVNTADDIDAVLHYFFNDVRRRVFGVSKSLGFYRFYDCRNPNKDLALAYMQQLAK